MLLTFYVQGKWGCDNEQLAWSHSQKMMEVRRQMLGFLFHVLVRMWFIYKWQKIEAHTEWQFVPVGYKVQQKALPGWCGKSPDFADQVPPSLFLLVILMVQEWLVYYHVITLTFQKLEVEQGRREGWYTPTVLLKGFLEPAMVHWPENFITIPYLIATTWQDKNTIRKQIS